METSNTLLMENIWYPSVQELLITKQEESQTHQCQPQIKNIDDKFQTENKGMKHNLRVKSWYFYKCLRRVFQGHFLETMKATLQVTLKVSLLATFEVILGINF